MTMRLAGMLFSLSSAPRGESANPAGWPWKPMMKESSYSGDNADDRRHGLLPGDASPVAPLRAGAARRTDRRARRGTDRAVLSLPVRRRRQGVSLAQPPQDVGRRPGRDSRRPAQ